MTGKTDSKTKDLLKKITGLALGGASHQTPYIPFNRQEAPSSEPGEELSLDAQANNYLLRKGLGEGQSGTRHRATNLRKLKRAADIRSGKKKASYKDTVLSKREKRIKEKAEAREEKGLPELDVHISRFRPNLWQGLWARGVRTGRL